jgi:hypothetical protein
MCSTSDCWGAPSQGSRTSYPEYAVINLGTANQQFVLQCDYKYTAPKNNYLLEKPVADAPFNDFWLLRDCNGTLPVCATGLHSLPAMFTTSTKDTRFKADYTPSSHSTKLPFDSQMHHGNPSDYVTFIDDNNFMSIKDRCGSLQSKLESHSPTTPQKQVGRRRGYEYVAPGSVRAVYLEKNRNAASKRRSKQKRQQKELVETARAVQVRNNMLKIEVETLKGSMCELLELVGQHLDCPDAGLRVYVQREADKLVAGGLQQTILSTMSGNPLLVVSSINKAASSGDDWRPLLGRMKPIDKHASIGYLCS